MDNKRFPLLSSIFILLILVGIIWAVLSVRSFFQRRELAKQAQKQVKVLEELSITLLEGWTVNDIAEYLEKNNIVSANTFISATKNVNPDDYPFLKNKPKDSGLEGFLFPDTYRIVKGATSEEILKKLLDNFGKRLQTAAVDSSIQNDRYILSSFPNLSIHNKPGISLFEAVTLASIVERESGGRGKDANAILEERKTVAGIFYNRLLIGQALQSDATINFITGAGRPSPTNEDLAQDSPYNTYKYPGLPPGPIGNPSLSSLIAVLNPIKTNYYYFLHKQPSGEVVYSRTFEEHVDNKFKYLK